MMDSELQISQAVNLRATHVIKSKQMKESLLYGQLKNFIKLKLQGDNGLNAL